MSVFILIGCVGTGPHKHMIVRRLRSRTQLPRPHHACSKGNWRLPYLFTSSSIKIFFRSCVGTCLRLQLEAAVEGGDEAGAFGAGN